MLPLSACTALKIQSDAAENAVVGIVHDAIGLIQRRRINMKRVGILHDELTRSHDAEARAALVPKFCLNLVEVRRRGFSCVVHSA